MAAQCCVKTGDGGPCFAEAIQQGKPAAIRRKWKRRKWRANVLASQFYGFLDATLCSRGLNYRP